MSVLVSQALCILQTERNSGRDLEDAAVSREAAFLLLIINMKGERCDAAQPAHNCDPSGSSIKRQNAHVYAPGWIIDPDSLCSCRCPRPEHGAPENFSLLASAQPRLRSICSQRCPNSGEARARPHECFIRHRYMQHAAAIFTSVSYIFPPVYGGVRLAAGGDTLKRTTSQQLQFIAVCSQVF